MADGLPSNIPRATRGELEVVLAMGRDRILEQHERCVLELLAEAREQVPIPRLLQIYERINGLDSADAAAVHHRVLVVLGRNGWLREDFARFHASESARHAFLETPRQLLSGLRRRIRGRVNLELRHWIELHVGRTQMSLLRVHTEHAARFSTALSGVMTPAAAVELYVRQSKVRPALGEALCWMVLERIADSSSPGPRLEQPRVEGPPRRPDKLRIVDETA